MLDPQDSHALTPPQTQSPRMALGIATALALVALREVVHAERVTASFTGSAETVARQVFAAALADAMKVGAGVALLGALVAAARESRMGR